MTPMRTWLTVLGLCLSLSVMAQPDKQEAFVWGLYLDLTDPVAREAAAAIDDAGFSIRIDSLANPPHLVLEPGNPGEIGRLLRKKKKDGVRVQSGNPGDCPEPLIVRDSLIRFKYIRNNFLTQFDYQLVDNIPQGVLNQGKTYTEKYAGRQFKTFKRYLKGKAYPPNNLEDFGWAMLGIPLNDAWKADEISFHFIKKKQKLVTLRFDTLRGQTADRFIALETGPCKPFDRTTEFKRLYGLKEYIKPSYYVPQGEEYFNRNFRLMFEKNRTDYSQASISEIIDLIRTQNLSIYRASVEGYASVEGSYENNVRLQERRAQVLIDVLERYNDERIKLDTVITTENWEMFREQMQKSSHAWLDSLSEEEVKEELEKDSLNRLLEPYLAAQRRAVLTLTLTKKLEDSEKVQYVFRDLNNMIQAYCQGIRMTFDVRSRIYGILNYIELMVERDLITKEEVLDRLPRSGILTEILFYKAWSDQKEGRFSKVYPLDKTITDAQRLFIEMYEAYARRDRFYDCIVVRPDVINKLVDVHDLAFLMVREGRIPQSTLSWITYPEIPRYYPLILHHLYMIHQLSEQGAGKTASISGGEVLVLDNDPRFYYMVKKIVLEGDEEILKNVYRSDQLLEFDLSWFLALNISGWDPFNKSYYDDEVDMEVMRKQLARLTRMRKYLCPWQVDQLNLDFHLKAVQYYIEHDFVDDNDNDKFRQSFEVLRRYFQQNASKLDEETLLKVANQFILVNRQYLTRDGTSAAYQVMKRHINGKEELSEEVRDIYLRLAYYHDPSFISLVRKYRPDDWCDLFHGKYGMIPYGSLETDYCSKCE